MQHGDGFVAEAASAWEWRSTGILINDPKVYRLPWR